MYSEVFKELPNGDLELVGDFEALYRKHDDPWQQSGTAASPKARYYANSRARLIEVLLQEFMIQEFKGLEVGCGHGHLTNLLAGALPYSKWTGLDVSGTAIHQAAQLYPNLRFQVGSIIAEDYRFYWDREAYDVVVLGQLLWYIVHKMDTAMLHIRRFLKPGGLLVVSQAFLKSEQRYARDRALGFAGTENLLGRYVPQDFEWVEAASVNSAREAYIDGLFVLRRVR